VSQALDPRTASRRAKEARQRKKETFTSLFRHLAVDLLAAAFAERDEDEARGRRRL